MKMAYFARGLVVLVLFALVGAGCHKKAAPLVGSGMELFAPAKVRVHPLSRITRDNGGATVEARLEFLDATGDVGKAVGTGYFELFPYDSTATAHKGQRLALWNFAIDTAEANRKQWDNITRTYLFTLGVPNPGALTGDRFILSGTLVMPDGRRLSNDLKITVKPVTRPS